MTGPFYPMPGNNANLIGKLIPHFLGDGNEVHLFSTAFGENKDNLPKTLFGIPVYWATDQKCDWKRKFLYPSVSKVVDPNGFSDALKVLIIQRELKEVYRKNSFDAVLATSEPYIMACSASRLNNVKKVLYLMDPPEFVSERKGTSFRNRTLPLIIKKQNAVITTPFILEALRSHSLVLPSQVETVGFPMVTPNKRKEKKNRDGKIRLLFCGWLYSSIRSPKFFLDIISCLDERFEITFMGKECELLQERFPTETKATIITLPNQPYDIALQAMSNADVLINIGNSVPVHMPSKTLEYINTGKPMINIYKLVDCPTLHYTKRYPLALNLFEQEKDFDSVVAQFIRFCEESIGKTVDHEWIEKEYAECTPNFIAQKIIDSLEK